MGDSNGTVALLETGILRLVKIQSLESASALVIRIIKVFPFHDTIKRRAAIHNYKKRKKSGKAA